MFLDAGRRGKKRGEGANWGANWGANGRHNSVEHEVERSHGMLGRGVTANVGWRGYLESEAGDTGSVPRPPDRAVASVETCRSGETARGREGERARGRLCVHAAAGAVPSFPRGRQHQGQHQRQHQRQRQRQHQRRSASEVHEVNEGANDKATHKQVEWAERTLHLSAVLDISLLRTAHPTLVVKTDDSRSEEIFDKRFEIRVG